MRSAEIRLRDSVDTDEHEQRLTETRGVLEAHRRHAARLREGLSLKLRLVHWTNDKPPRPRVVVRTRTYRCLSSQRNRTGWRVSGPATPLT